jgi:hypothetical protein
MITFVPNPSAVRTTMRKAPDVLLRTVAIANHVLRRRRRSDAVTAMEIRVRMR